MEVLSKQGIRLRGLVERGLGYPGFGCPVTRLSPTDLAADHWGMGELHWDQRKHSSEPIPKGRRIESWASWMVVSSGEVHYTPYANRYILPLEQHRFELHGSTLHRFLSVNAYSKAAGLQLVESLDADGWLQRVLAVKLYADFQLLRAWHSWSPALLKHQLYFISHIITSWATKYLFAPICSLATWKNLFKRFLSLFKYRPWWISCSLTPSAIVRNIHGGK